jgi:exonuclease III
MGGWPTAKNKVNASNSSRLGNPTARLECLQINVQHPNLATDNLRKILEEHTDIICIQEPYNIGNKIGLPQHCIVLTAGEGSKGTAIIINNRHTDAILITHLSDEDATVMEVRVGRDTFVVASTYFDIKRPIDYDLQKMQAVMTRAKGMEIVFAMDSNARSTSWHYLLTNKRGRAMEEFIISKRLHIANEESCYTTFQTCRGASNIDLTVINNTAINYLQEWVVYDGESRSDHNIIKYTLGNDAVEAAEKSNTDTRCIVTSKNMETFQEAVIQRMKQIALEMGMEGKGEDELDEILCQRATATPNIEMAVDELQTVLDYACRS